MGRMLGAHDPDAVIDRPDLNKCPDCECFFQQLNCPLCGKVCPEEMRAGNRKPVKIKKKRSSGTGRVTFVEWYHSWWFIALLIVIFPLAGIVLLVTSPHKKWAKTTFGVVAAVYLVVSSTIGWGAVLDLFGGNEFVDDSLTREEYIAACETVDAESYYRSAENYHEKPVCVTLTVVQKIVGYDNTDVYDSDYVTYYLCRALNGAQYEILLRDCQLGDVQNLVAGDVITVYGAGAGTISFDDANFVTYSSPGIYAAYIVVH